MQADARRGQPPGGCVRGSWLRNVAACGLVVATFALAACGGGSQSGPTSTVAVPTPTGTPNDADAEQAFDALAEQFAGLKGYRAVYDLKVVNTQGSGMSARITFEQVGTSTRTELAGTADGDGTALTTIYDGKHLYSCADNACQEAASGLQFQDPLSTYSPARIVAAAKQAQDITFHTAASDTINGVKAECFLLNQGAAKSTFCLDPETGILLSLDGSVDQQGKTATTTMRAREAAKTLETIDVKPPFPVTKATPTGS